MNYEDLKAILDVFLQESHKFYLGDVSQRAYNKEEIYMLGFLTGCLDKVLGRDKKDVALRVSKELEKVELSLGSRGVIKQNLQTALTCSWKDLSLLIGRADLVTTKILEYRLKVGR